MVRATSSAPSRPMAISCEEETSDSSRRPVTGLVAQASRRSAAPRSVAANAALNRRRSLGRARAREKELALRQAAGTDLPASPRDPEGSASGAQLQARIQDALLELPDDLRMAVVLYDIEGQSYKEIAQALGIPEGTVKSRIHRARNALRGLLRELVGTDGSGVAT